jgi:hypothetical protein
MNAVDDAVKTMDAAIDEIAALRMERDDWKGRYDTLLAIWEELRAENKLLKATAPSSEAALAAIRAKTRIAIIGLSFRAGTGTDDLLGVCIGGRWDGWLMRKHPDGQWVSVRKLETEDPLQARPSSEG